ncbi:terminase [bacterium]|nr:terminase [bacterium]
MEVSRKDVIFDKIVDFQYDPRRFIKVPVDRYLSLLGIKTLSAQNAIINAVNNPKYRFIVAAVSRRLGKTYIANLIGQMVTLIPGSHVLIMSPNYRLSQISFDLQRNLIKHFNLEVAKDNAKDSVIELENGSTIRMGSVNQVDSVVGRSYDLIIFDEAALTDAGEEAFNIALRPTLDKENSKALFISTPRGKNNWFSKFYNRGFSDDFPEWVSIHATYLDNPRVDARDIEEAKRTMSDAEFRQEYMADFSTFEGRIWDFNFETQVRDLSNLDLSKMDIFAGMDVGYKDPMAFCVFAYEYDTSNYYVISEYYSSENTTSKHAKAVQYYIDKYNIDYIFIDSAAAQFRADLAADYGISTINAKKSVLDGIAHVSAIIENNRLFVDQKCIETLKSLEGYQWDKNPTLLKEKPLHNWACHMADAIRYGLYSFTNNASTF